MVKFYGILDFERVYAAIPPVDLVENFDEYRHWVAMCFAQGYSADDLVKELSHDNS